MPLCLGMAGNQVLEWADLDTEIKTAGVKDVGASFFYQTMCQDLTSTF